MKKYIIPALYSVLVLFSSIKADAQEGMLGEVRMFAGNFAPRGWATCEGQLLAISQHQALFSILGTTYGGDGRTTFALPDLRGRAPIQTGTGRGLTPARLGQKGGASTKVKKGDDAIVPGQPTLAINYIICMRGVFPSRS